MRPLAVQLYSVRDQLSVDRAGTLSQIAKIGYTKVEPYDPLNDPSGFRTLIDGLGLSVCSTHAPVLGERRDELPDALATIGCDTVIVPAIREDGFADLESVQRTADRLNETAAWAAQHGLRLGYHNHWWELSQQVDGVPALEALVSRLAPEVILEVDVYWVAVGGVDVPQLLGRLGDRVKYLHVKDGPATREAPMTAVGAGTLPIPEILAAAPADAWRVIELDECATDMVTALAESYTYVDALVRA
jgi:sugar phosphate isomerase/epimerase